MSMEIDTFSSNDLKITNYSEKCTRNGLLNKQKNIFTQY